MVDIAPSESSSAVDNLPASSLASELEKFMKMGFSRVIKAKSDDIIDIDELKISSKSKFTDDNILVDR
jgi:hypothetical protein